MTDVPELVRQLAVLRRALAAATTPGRLDDRATPHPTVAAVLVPTPPPAAGGRRVPSSRPPVNLDLIVLDRNLTDALIRLAADLRGALQHTTRDHTADAALHALSEHYSLLDDDSPLARRISALLDSWIRLLRRQLGLNEPVLLLGPCPSVGEPRTVATRSGEVVDGGCWTPDRQAIADAALRGENVQLWRRSQLSIPRDHPDPLHATIECRSCGWQCTPEDRAPDIVLAAGLDMLVTPGQAAALLAVPPGTVWSWAHRGQIVSLEKGRTRRYSLLAVARVVVRQRLADHERMPA